MDGKPAVGVWSQARRVPRLATLLLTVALVLPAVPLAALVSASPALALNNGLAVTPPMGWNDWNAYGCNVSEQLVEQTALAMHNDGLQAAGYQYVNIDDCWMASSRNSSGNLVPNSSKFPDGIAAVASYVHSLGLKLGIYEDAGTATCAGYPGSYGHEQQDANLFASWGVDYVKYDWCNIPFSSFPNQTHQQVAQTLYTRMRDALSATGRPIVFSMCNGWDSSVRPWTWAGPVANLWRTSTDIQPNFSSMLSNFHTTVGLAAYAGPGAWNDPDMLEIGNGMTATEDQSEFSLWAEMAAPLIEGSNLTNANSTTLSILTNKAVIAVDQDSLGKQGTEVSSSGGLDVLAKPLANGDVSVALFNETGSAATISTTAAAIGKSGASSYTLTNLWTGATSTTSGAISASVPAHGTVMYRVASNTPPTSPPPTSPPPTSPPPSSPPPGTCHVSYTTASQWAGGFVANVTIANTGTATINGWSLKFTFPGDQQITSAWNATETQSGETATLTNVSYDGTIPPGGNTQIGFQGTWNSSDAAPTSFTLNGTTCT
jgi:alpha-galactosidase